MTQRHVVFDFDGTIADSFEVTMRGFVTVLKSFGLVEPDEDKIVSELKSLSLKKRMSKFDVSREKMDELVEKSQKEVLKTFDQVKPFEGIKEMLDKLKKRGLIIGILTSNLKECVDIFVNKNDFDLFDYVYYGCGLFNKKEMIERLADEQKASKKDIVYVGDEVRDVDGARKAGVKTIAVSWGFDGRKILKKSKPDFLVDRPEEIIDVVDKNFF